MNHLWSISAIVFYAIIRVLSAAPYWFDIFWWMRR